MKIFIKDFNLKIISLIISISVLFTNSLYSYPISKDSLRVPMASSHERIEKVLNAHRGKKDEVVYDVQRYKRNIN